VEWSFKIFSVFIEIKRCSGTPEELEALAKNNTKNICDGYKFI
jgi:hypothetical protein